MEFNINLRFQPSGWFIGVLAELNERYSDWTDGSYDWAAQTTDFLNNPVPLWRLALAGQTDRGCLWRDRGD